MNTLNVHSEEFRSQPSVQENRSATEFRGLRHETKDILMQLQSNIQRIEDLNGRLGFVLSEVRTLIRR